MKKEIIINSSSSINRVAITEEGSLVDYFVDHPEKERMVGDVYYGRVARVLPGIRAAFINIGLKHDAFLHFSDVGDSLKEMKDIFSDDEDDDDVPAAESNNNAPKKESKHHSLRKRVPDLKKGEEILVQIIKEPVKDKGVRVSSAISLPGRFCVLLPFDNKIGVSKKIGDYRERKRLRRIARGILPKDCGLIIRTAARRQSEESLVSDLRYLLKMWDDIQENVKKSNPPELVYKDLSTTISVIRDLFTSDVSRVLIDGRKLYREIRNYVKFVQPSLADKIEYSRGNVPLFEKAKIEKQINELMGRKVPIPNGGDIVIEHTEAMTVIDVNSGRYAAKKEQELNSLKTDLEAAREIVRQLRLRDIGGLIVVDFIDLEENKNRKKIYDELKKEFRRDRAKTALLPMTDFGIIQITRQRIRENILQSMTEACPYCNGTGILTKKSNVIHEIADWLRRYKLEGKHKKLVINVHPSLLPIVNTGIFSMVRKWRWKFGLSLKVEGTEKINPQTFQIISAKTGVDLTEDFS